MSTETATDLQIICQAIAEGRKIESALAKRVQERSAGVRETFEEELSVQLIREIRSE